MTKPEDEIDPKTNIFIRIRNYVIKRVPTTTFSRATMITTNEQDNDNLEGKRDGHTLQEKHAHMHTHKHKRKHALI